MFKTLLLSAAIAASVSHAMAEPRPSRDLSILPPDVAARVVYLQGYGERFEAAIDATFAEWAKPSATGAEHELDMSILPPEVAAQVQELQKHGNRFEGAIRAIFIEAFKPGWSFGSQKQEAVDDGNNNPKS